MHSIQHHKLSAIRSPRYQGYIKDNFRSNAAVQTFYQWFEAELKRIGAECFDRDKGRVRKAIKPRLWFFPSPPREHPRESGGAINQAYIAFRELKYAKPPTLYCQRHCPGPKERREREEEDKPERTRSALGSPLLFLLKTTLGYLPLRVTTASVLYLSGPSFLSYRYCRLRPYWLQTGCLMAIVKITTEVPARATRSDGNANVLACWEKN